MESVSSEPKYRRILLKLSGEIMAGERSGGIDAQATERIVADIRAVRDADIQVGIVIGGGNIFRAREVGELGVDRVPADYMGMLATVVNALALQGGLQKRGVPSRVLSATEMAPLVERFVRDRAIDYLEERKAVIFAGGTGHPYFTTDTAAALRALEIGADVILKGTKVDGVYDMDPKTAPSASKFESLAYLEALKRRLKVMDATAISLCMDNGLPIVVFDITKPGNLAKAAAGYPIGTTVKERDR